jgi:hypothetical protein
MTEQEMAEAEVNLRQTIADAERNSASQLYLDAMGVALEICRDHGLATGHGDTLADILREINGQLKERL